MWKYTEVNAYDSISLHDCKTDHIQIVENDLLIHFPDGFWLTPVSKYNNHESPIKTGPAQLRFIGLDAVSVIDSIDLYKTTYLFRKPILCRRIQPEIADFLKHINDGKHELEFLCEYHNAISALYECWVWKKNYGMEAECQLELTVKNVEYYWNEIHQDRKW